MIPLSTDRPIRSTPVVNYWIVFLNVAIAIAMELMSAEQVDRFITTFGFQSMYPEWWQFVTSAFLHGGLLHLLGNMVFLWVFGNAVEDRFGHLGYALFYVSGAMLSAIGHGLVDLSPAIGASGAISAVAGAFIVLFPQTRIKVLWIFIIITVINVPSLWFIGFNIARDLFGWAFFDSNVAYMAHISGYLSGGLVAFALLYFRTLAREPYDLMTMISQWNRRRQFRSVTKRGFDPWSGGPKPLRPAQGDEAESKHNKESSERPRRPASNDRDRATRSSADDVGRSEPRTGATAGSDTTADRAGADPGLNLRVTISEAAAAQDLPRATRAYRELLTFAPDTTLNRDMQLSIANQLMREGDHALAAEAYRRLLASYPTSDPTGQVRLMLGLLLVRYLGFADSEEARRTLEHAMERLPEGGDRELGRTLLEEVGIAVPSDLDAAEDAAPTDTPAADASSDGPSTPRPNDADETRAE